MNNIRRGHVTYYVNCIQLWRSSGESTTIYCCHIESRGSVCNGRRREKSGILGNPSRHLDRRCRRHDRGWWLDIGPLSKWRARFQARGYNRQRCKSVMSESSKQSEHSSASTTESAPRQQNPHESTVVITAQDGTVTTVFADSLKHRQYSRELVLQNGQHISFDNIKMLEVVRLYDDHAKVKITLLNDKVVEGSLDAGLYPFGFEAQNDIGQFGISVSQLKRIVFQR